jgi:hypothetical protein
MNFTLKQRPQSVLGLSCHDGRLGAVLLARSKSGLETVQTASAALSLDLLQPEAALVGREIANHLDAAGIRERTCVIAVPAAWVMTQHSALPDLPPADLDSLLQIEAEQGFPCDPGQLQIARSIQRSGAAAYVTQLAVRREHLDRLGAVAKAAGLKPVSLSLGRYESAGPTSAGASSTESDAQITVALDSSTATLMVAVGGGIAALRTCQAAIESEAGERVANGAAVARELRITYEQVPAGLRGQLRRLVLCGDEALVGQLVERLGSWAAAVGLTLVRPTGPAEGLEQAVAREVAAGWLAPRGPRIEFLPPRRSRWEAMMARYNSKRLAATGAAAGALIALTLGVFGWQEVRLWSLRSEWEGMRAQVADLKTVQDQIRTYRPWYDRSSPDLRILARVTQCFPENGSLTAKSFDVHQTTAATTVSISGTARDGQALLRTQEKLRKAGEIQGLKVESISGKMPAQFTLTFRWVGGPGS